MDLLNKIQKYLILVVFIMMVVVPILQFYYPLFEVKPLKNDELEEKPELTFSNWMDGNFQKKYDEFIKDHIGFRNFFIRINNQIDFSIFKKGTAKDIIVGKENYLYEFNYLKAYTGIDFIGADNIKAEVDKIKKLQNYLDEREKTLIVCFVPGKGSFYPEYFPKAYHDRKTENSNYKIYNQYLKEADINFIDFNKWFLEMKDTSQYTLYPKYGIHWSHYGMLLSADSLIRYIEKVRNIDMINIEMYDFEISNIPQYTDNDIIKGMNLLFEPEYSSLCYPKIKWVLDSNYVKPKVLVIGDSFYWNMYGIGLDHNSFGLGGYWYYNEQIYPSYNEKLQYVNREKIASSIDNNDIIIIMSTEANLPLLSFGYINSLYDCLFISKDQYLTEAEKFALQNRIENLIEFIKSDEEWYGNVKNEAKEKNMSLDSMLYFSAKWVIDQEND